MSARPPLSFPQREAWLETQLAADVPLGNAAIAIRCPSPLHVALLERAFSELVRRHEAWRTTLGVEDGRPVPVVQSPTAIRLPVVDLRGSHDAECEALALATADARHRFDLAQGPLYRAWLARLPADEFRLHLTLHRSIADGASIRRCLLPELAALYAAAAEDRPTPTAPTLQYRDFAARQRRWAESAEAACQLEYWRRQLAGPPPVLELFADRARPPTRGFRGARHRIALGDRLTDTLRTVSREADVSLFVLLLAGFVALLHRYTGEDDVVVGTLATGRNSAELQGLLGSFVNPLALRLDLTGEPSFRTLLHRARDVVDAAFAHEDVPFEHVVNAVEPTRERGRYPLFSNLFTFEPLAAPPPPGWELMRLDVDPGAAAFDVHLDVHENADEVVGLLTYRTDLFEPATIVRLGAHFQRLLDAAVRDLDRPVSRLSLLDEGERHRIVVEWNKTASPYPSAATVHALFEAQVARAAHRVAVVAGDLALTYGELNRRADAVARRLRALGLGPGAIVGVAMERSPEAIVGYLAALKAGAAYLPLSINDPPERIAFMVADAGVSVILTRPAATPLARVDGVTVLEIGEAWEPVHESAAPVVVTPDDAMYVMYTSGSTGRPKGVVVPHRGIVRLLFGDGRYLRLGPDEAILQSTALSFDVSAFEIWGALVHGARLVLYPSEVPTTRELREVIRAHGITTMWLTPSVFNMLVDEDPECLALLRQLDLGGEALSVPHVARAAAAMPSTALINGYGPTECSVSACAYRIPRPVEATAASIPIGLPIANTSAYVLDRHRSPVAIGIPGELYLGGPGVALGYVNRPAETAARFITDPFDPRPGAKLYRTGDLVRWRSDGVLEFLGRLDSQVKIRGLRIELGEIEAVLSRHAAVREAAVVVQEEGGKRLVAYVVARAGSVVNADDLRQHVRRALPAYMVPAAFVVLETLPLTPNGKLDRRALASAAHAPVRAPHPPVAVHPGSLEAQLVGLWRELLDGPSPGIRDDFFELGGDSLTAARMIQQIRDLTGSALPLSALYESPTIEGLARLLRQHGNRTADLQAPAVTLNGGGDRTPIFLFHGMLTGGAFYALRLARRLGPRQPLHVVHPFTGLDGPVPSTIEVMAERHLAVVRSRQRQGPYRLVGYCNGGLVAYEIARRLQEAGDAVELLVLIAAAPVTPLTRTGRLLRRVGVLAGVSPDVVAEPVARLRSFLEAVAMEPPGQRLAFVGAKLVRLARRLSGRRAAAAAEPAETPDVMELYHRIFMRYFAPRYPGPLVLLWPDDEPWGSANAAAKAWRRLAASVTVHEIPGDHLAVVHDHLDVLAAHLEPYLSDAASRDQAKGTPSAGVHIAVPPTMLPFAELLEHACEVSLCLV